MEVTLPTELNQMSTDGCPRSQGEQSLHAHDSSLPSSSSRPTHDQLPDVSGSKMPLEESTKLDQPGEALNREDNEDTCL